jgi:uncharacterized repeat protein (TIGR03803 family)
MHKTISCLLVLVLGTFLLTITATQTAKAQTFTVLHQFTGVKDGWFPRAGLTIDSTGKLYGTAEWGGAKGFGTAFRLSPPGSKWAFKTLHSFNGGFDGAYPEARVIIGPNGTLYGTTTQGGNGFCNGGGCGIVFNLKLSGAETVLYRFVGGVDGTKPGNGELAFDTEGNIYGTTELGGPANLGTVFSLTFAYGSWAETRLHSFGGGIGDGAIPFGGVIFDNAGNLYGTTVGGGNGGGGNGGTVFQLTPSGTFWTETVLYEFCQNVGDGCNPSAGLIFDQSGNLYGSAASAVRGSGAVFELANGAWKETVLYLFTGGSGGASPEGALTMDAAGNLYGTTAQGGAYGNGTVFKLTNGSWTYTSLHDFTGGSDGASPVGNVIFDSSGNLYGTAAEGGTFGKGVVWKIAP